jgi:hypothetical protein
MIARLLSTRPGGNPGSMAELYPELIPVRNRKGERQYNATGEQARRLVESGLGEPIGHGKVKYIRLRTTNAQAGRLPVAQDSITTVGTHKAVREHHTGRSNAYNVARRG